MTEREFLERLSTDWRWDRIEKFTLETQGMHGEPLRDRETVSIWWTLGDARGPWFVVDFFAERDSRVRATLFDVPNALRLTSTWTAKQPDTMWAAPWKFNGRDVILDIERGPNAGNGRATITMFGPRADDAAALVGFQRELDAAGARILGEIATAQACEAAS
ncbi:MAG TPA: hypothetical protein VF183_07395 [Acidimicrobiales bacterium]